MSKLREQLKQRGLKTELIEIDGIQFQIKELHPIASSEIISSSRDSKGKEKQLNMMDGRLLSACVCDDEGEQVYSDEEWQCWFSEVGSSITRPLMAEVMRINGLVDPEVSRLTKKS